MSFGIVINFHTLKSQHVEPIIADFFLLYPIHKEAKKKKLQSKVRPRNQKQRNYFFYNLVLRFVNKNERKKEREKEKASIQNQRLALIPVGSKLPFFWNLKIQKSNIQVFYLKGQNFPRFSQHSKKLQRRRALQTQVLAAYGWDSVSISGASFLFIQSSDFVFYLKELIIFHTPCNSQVSNTRFKIYKKRIGVCMEMEKSLQQNEWTCVALTHLALFGFEAL